MVRVPIHETFRCAAASAGGAGREEIRPRRVRPRDTSRRRVAAPTKRESPKAIRSAARRKIADRIQTEFFRETRVWLRRAGAQMAAVLAAWRSRPGLKRVRSLRNFHRADHLPDHLVRRETFEIGLGLQEHAMAKHGH